MLVSGLSGQPCSVGFHTGFAWLMCFACRLCKNVQFAASAFVLVACFCSLSSLPFSGNGITKVYGVISISTDSVSVTVPGGCSSQGCRGYLPALLEARISLGSTIP